MGTIPNVCIRFCFASLSRAIRHGSGRKAKNNFLSPVLLAVYDDEEEVYKSISRCMTFTDDMYNATREFYFNGTPYPPNVGVGEDTAGKPLIVTSENRKCENVVFNDDVDGESDGEGTLGDQDNEFDPGIGTGMNPLESRENCFPNRPSNTLIVTNESPPIWFRPSEGEAKFYILL